MLRPANPLGWQQITSNWRERARAETCVRSFACLLRLVSPSSHCRAVAKPCHKNSARRYVPEAAMRSVTWAAKAHMKLTFARIERNPHRRRFASA